MERVREQRQVGVDVRVDEAGRDDPAGDVEPPPGLGAAEGADGGDPVAPNPHVRPKPGVAGAIDHATACQHEIEHERSLFAREWSPRSRSPGARTRLL